MYLFNYRLATIFFSLILSLFILYLSFDDIRWGQFWSFFYIPVGPKAFSDFDALNIFLSYKEMGLNPYIENPESHPIHKFLIYPSIWLNITDILNLNKELNFKIISFLILFIYFYVLFDFFIRLKKPIFGFFLLIFFFFNLKFFTYRKTKC